MRCLCRLVPLLCLALASAEPPWPAQYKLRPDETARLTAADVVGPDGLVYPDWRRCGVPGGVPATPVVARLAEFGGVVGGEIADSLTRGSAAVARRGGGALLLDAGTYYIDRPVALSGPGVVLRGAGREATRLVFRYAIAPSGIAFYTPRPATPVPPGTLVELHCRPQGLVSMTIELDGRPLANWAPSTHSGNTFWLRADTKGLAPGPHHLRGTGAYKDGRTRVTELAFTCDPTAPRPVVPESQAALGWQGGGPRGPKLELAQDGRRGDTSLTLKSVDGLRPGDWLLLEGPATERWKTLTRNKCLWGSYRRNLLRVAGLEGTIVRLDEPLRLEFPVVDGSFVQPVDLVRGCGFEDLTIEQTEDLWITAARFNWAVGCWASGVRVRKCGRFPVYTLNAKQCELRDCVFDDAWFKGGGGTAYSGFEVSYDCLMDRVETFKLRHGPLVQWSASGCVIRRSVFHDSDAQWHSGWTNENLFEQCVVESKTGNGGYGYGMWASPPEDTAHGPNGPRNVIYACDVSSPKAGLWLGGMNEGWLVLYNRFVVGAGPGIFAKTVSFDHTVRGNTFVLRDGKSPLALLQTADCTGLELLDNRLYGGNGKLSGGAGQPLRVAGNEVLPLGDAARPTPPVESIFEWQRKRH